MKIISFISKNIKNLKAVEIAPDGNAVVLTGKNGAGKSAVIDSIFSALTGKRLKDPVRHGEDRADVVVDMGDFTVKKRWTSKGEAIEVYSTNDEGKKVKYSSPQTFLDEKIGRLSFDPLAFKDMKPRDQVELLKEIVKLNFDDINAESKKIYDERAVINSRIRDSIVQLQNSEAPGPDTPTEELSFKDELRKIQELREKRQTFLTIAGQKNDYEQRIERNGELVKECREAIKDLELKIENFQKDSDEIRASEQYLQPQIPEVTQEQIIAAEEALQDIENQNVVIKAANRYRANAKQAEKHKKEADAFTEKIKRLEQDKSTRVANATFPIKGLSLSDDSVIYEGVHFDRLSTGQQIRVSTAIGMALNPELKIIFIRQGALLDKANLKEIISQAQEKDYQVWIEVCSDSKQVGFHIEDGTITSIDGKEVKK